MNHMTNQENEFLQEMYKQHEIDVLQGKTIQTQIAIWMIATLLIVLVMVLDSILFPKNILFYAILMVTVILLQAICMISTRKYYQKKIKNIKVSGIRVH